MTLLITIFAAIAATLLWYKNAPDNSMRYGTLALIYWGASLMWFADAIFEYAELGAEFFTPAAFGDGSKMVKKAKTEPSPIGSFVI